MGTQWCGMGKEMMTIPRFKKSIMNSDAVLRPYGVDLHKLLTEGLDDDFNDTVNSFVGIAAIQVNLTLTCGKCITYFVCLYNYEFLLSLCKIVRSSVILLLPLCVYKNKNIYF